MQLSRKSIFLLYVLQGLPFGVQSDISPFLLKSWGFSYQYLGLVNLAFWPWVMKPLFAPYLENSGSGALLGALGSLVAVHVGVFAAIYWRSGISMALLLLLSNVCAAMYDIIVDKHAILSRRQEHVDCVDITNAVQVVGYKLGGLLAGSFVMSLSSLFCTDYSSGLAISPLVSALLTSTFAWSIYRRGLGAVDEEPEHPAMGISATDTLFLILSHIRSNIWMYVLLLSYKCGESMGDKLLKLFLVENGMEFSGLASLNIWNDIIGILGSCTALWFPRNKYSDKNNLLTVLILNILPQMLRYTVVKIDWLQSLYPTVAVCAIEHFIGGAVTVALFNFMFSNVVPSIEGTHYSVFASFEVCGKLWAGSWALYMVPVIGFERIFGIAIICSIFPVLLIFFSNTGPRYGSDIVKKNR